MIIVGGKLQVRRGLERELPGSPITITPPTFSAALDEGELGFTTDTARLFVGYVPALTDQNYQRTVFPYQNLEILTENSPRNRELFGESVRDQDATDFFVATTLATGANNPITYPTGVLNPTIMTDTNVSATFEYHAFSAASAPIQQGIVRFSGSGGIVTIVQNEVIGSGLAFDGHFTSPSYFLTCTNSSGAVVNLYLRRVVIGL